MSVGFMSWFNANADRLSDLTLEDACFEAYNAAGTNVSTVPYNPDSVLVVTSSAIFLEKNRYKVPDGHGGFLDMVLAECPHPTADRQVIVDNEAQEWHEVCTLCRKILITRSTHGQHNIPRP